MYFDGNFENGEPNGDSIRIYDEDGVLWYEGSIVKGVKQGFGKEYHENGKLMFEGNFKEGFPDGVVTTYHTYFFC